MDTQPTTPSYQVGMGDALLFRSRVIFIVFFLLMLGIIVGAIYAANATGDIQRAQKSLAQGWTEFSKALSDNSTNPQANIPSFTPLNSSTSSAETTTTTTNYNYGSSSNDNIAYPTAEPTIDYNAKLRQAGQAAQAEYNQQVQQDNAAFQQGAQQNQQQYNAANTQAQQQMDQFKQQSDQKTLEFQQQYGITPMP